MKNQPLVSVITITRNRGKLIGRCIDSVLNQTYKNIEHIIVDGASNDETDAVVASYNDSRLHFLKLEDNWSLEKTYKHGTAQAKGKYICFLDSDDEYLPTKIEKQVTLIESLPLDYGMVYCWMTYFDSSKNNSVIRVHNPQLRGFVPLEAAEKPTVSGTPVYGLTINNVFVKDRRSVSLTRIPDDQWSMSDTYKNIVWKSLISIAYNVISQEPTATVDNICQLYIKTYGSSWITKLVTFNNKGCDIELPGFMTALASSNITSEQLVNAYQLMVAILKGKFTGVERMDRDETVEYVKNLQKIVSEKINSALGEAEDPDKSKEEPKEESKEEPKEESKEEPEDSDDEETGEDDTADEE